MTGRVEYDARERTLADRFGEQIDAQFSHADKPPRKRAASRATSLRAVIRGTAKLVAAEYGADELRRVFDVAIWEAIGSSKGDGDG